MITLLTHPHVKEWTQGIWLPGLDTEDTIDIALGIDIRGL